MARYRVTAPTFLEAVLREVGEVVDHAGDPGSALEPLDAVARHDLLEILEERYGRRSTMITSQLPVDRWHEIIGEPMTS